MHEKGLQSFINAGVPQETINKMIEMWEDEANARNAEADAAAAKKAKQNQRNREVQQQLKATREGFQRVARNLGRG
jgi:DNA-binding transcriptional MerR regulator